MKRKLTPKCKKNKKKKQKRAQNPFYNVKSNLAEPVRRRRRGSLADGAVYGFLGCGVGSTNLIICPPFFSVDPLICTFGFALMGKTRLNRAT